MNLVQEFKISDQDSIKILVPNNVENKLNYYDYPTEQLHLFDQLTVVLQQKDLSTELARDMTDYTLGDFQDALIKVLNKKNSLPVEYNIKDLGILYNINSHTDNENRFDLTQFSIWSNVTTITWLYRKNNHIYLEISPKYPWLYEEYDPLEHYISFQDFMRAYKSVALYEISREIAEQWLTQCNVILDEIAKLSGYKNYKDSIHPS